MPIKEKCGLCGKNEKLVDSHIIPKSFYFLNEYNHLKIYSNKGSHPKKLPKGIYDQIVCESCERIFAKGDNYIIKFIKELDKLTIPKSHFYIINKFNIDLIDQFIISLMLRSNLTNKIEFKEIQMVEKYNKLFKDYLFGNILFPVEIQYFIRKYDQQIFITSPIRRKIENCDCYIFSLGICEITIKIDQKSLSDNYALIINHTEKFYIPLLPHKDTFAYKALQSIQEF